MPIWTIAKKDLRLLVRDRRAVIILLVMPLVFIAVLGLSLGEGFAQKPDNRLRISFVNLDEGKYDRKAGFPDQPWSQVVLNDLADTAGIRVEQISDLDAARDLVRTGRRAAVLVFGPHFSADVSRCSFLKQGINPFYRDGVKLRVHDAGQPAPPSDGTDLDVELVRDPTQRTASSIIEQVAQVSLLRTVLPYMIGRAFRMIGDPSFLALLSKEKALPSSVRMFLVSPFVSQQQRQALSDGLQGALQQLFSKYDLRAMTWAKLTRSEPKTGSGGAITAYQATDARYQILVPAYTVMFAFFLVLTVGWLFVAERRQGTLRRLRAAPLTRTQIVLGKLLPCFAVSLFQGVFLLAAGRVLFGMSWGPHPGWLLLVVLATSLAAMGLALLIATLARTETQVAIYGTLIVLVLAGVSGCLMGDRALMPETMQQVSLFTPHAWALVAYKQLLTTSAPNLGLVLEACGVLAAFGVGFIGLAWGFLDLQE
ncbi:MAG TPA: ABC transporter permease [Gemmataceae bacterium]|nr:ABC transporter permease [Gemmataceae bacterium]